MAFETKRWGPLSPRAVLLLIHGLGSHSMRWEDTACFLADKGIASYAVELIDQSDPVPSYEAGDSFAGYYEKVKRLYEIAAKDNPEKKIFLAGESMGALISFLYVSRHPQFFSGLICISPAFANRRKLSLPDTLRIFLCLFYDRKKELDLPFDPSNCTRDPSYRDKLYADRLWTNTISVCLAFEILKAQKLASFVRCMKVPVLFLVAGEDSIADPAASKAIFNRLNAADKTLIEYPGMYHALSIELGRQKVFGDIFKWINKRI